jgi:type IV pilus assembly protein PilM
MIWRAGKSISPIGLDLGSRQVKAVQLRRAGSGWTLHAAASLPRGAPDVAPGEGKPFTADEARRIASVLDRRGFKRDEIVLAVPSERLLAMSLELPPRTPQMPFDQIARQEFARSVRASPSQLKQELDAFEFAYWDLPSPARAAKATNVMAVGCATAMTEPVVEGFSDAGLNVASIDVEPCAIARACEPLLAPPEQITAILDIGWQSARLSIIYQNTITYWRGLAALGSGAMRHSLAQQLDVPDDVVQHMLEDGKVFTGDSGDDSGIANQARRAVLAHADTLVGEVTTSLSYAAHQYPDASVGRVLLVGGGAMMPGLCDYYAAALGLDVHVAPASELIDIENAGAENDPLECDMVLAIGLAQHQLGLT